MLKRKRLPGLVLAGALAVQLVVPAMALEPFGGQISAPEQVYSGQSATLTLTDGSDFTGSRAVTLTADNAPDCVEEGMVLREGGQAQIGARAAQVLPGRRRAVVPGPGIFRAVPVEDHALLHAVGGVVGGQRHRPASGKV